MGTNVTMLCVINDNRIAGQLSSQTQILFGYGRFKGPSRFDKRKKQAGAELGQAQLPTGTWLYCDYHLLMYIDLSGMTRHLVVLYLLSRPTFQFTPF